MPKGVAQIEAGYTVLDAEVADPTFAGVTTASTLHSAPITLRYGVRNWLELRVTSGVTHLSQDLNIFGITVAHAAATGINDIGVGVKAALCDQCGPRPEVAALVEIDIPTGDTLSSKAAYPTLGLIYQWDFNERVSLKASTQGTGTRGTAGDDVLLIFQSAVLQVELAERLQGFSEWAAVFTSPDEAPFGGPSFTSNSQLLNFGFRYAATNNLQFDVHGGFGLTDDAADEFIGAGIVYRR